MDRLGWNPIYPFGSPLFAFLDAETVYVTRYGYISTVIGPNLFRIYTDSEINETLQTDRTSNNTIKDDELFAELSPDLAKQDLKRIEQLIKEGANINCINGKGFTPLHYANCPEISAFLIEHGADVNAIEESGSTPLHVANYDHDCNRDTMSVLLFYNADTSISDVTGNTPIMKLMMKDNDNGCQCLIKNIWILLEYEHDFSDVNEAGSSLLTLAMLSEQQCFVDAIIERGGNFSTLSKDFEVLMWCIDQPNTTEFKWFWNIFDYKDAWFFKQPILYHLLKKDKYEAFDYVINSPKLQDVFDVWFGDHEYKQDTILYNMECQEEEFNFVHILNATTLNYNRERVEKAIYILLSNGYEPSEHEVQEIYQVCGYGERFQLCLNFDVLRPRNISNLNSVVPKILLNPDRSGQEIINQSVIYTSHLRKASFIATMSHIYDHRNNEVLRYIYDSDQAMLHQLPSRRVSSLQELSRNQVLLGIWKQYNVKKRSQFWNVMKNIPLPTIIKDLILFKSPIYN